MVASVIGAGLLYFSTSVVAGGKDGIAIKVDATSIRDTLKFETSLPPAKKPVPNPLMNNASSGLPKKAGFKEPAVLPSGSSSFRTGSDQLNRDVLDELLAKVPAASKHTGDDSKQSGRPIGPVTAALTDVKVGNPVTLRSERIQKFEKEVEVLALRDGKPFDGSALKSGVNKLWNEITKSDKLKTEEERHAFFTAVLVRSDSREDIEQAIKALELEPKAFEGFKKLVTEYAFGVRHAEEIIGLTGKDAYDFANKQEDLFIEGAFVRTLENKLAQELYHKDFDKLSGNEITRVTALVKIEMAKKETGRRLAEFKKQIQCDCANGKLVCKVA